MVRYPARTKFSATDPAGTCKLELIWEVRSSSALWKYPLIVFEQLAHFTGHFYRRSGRRWREVAAIDELGFCEYTASWVKGPGTGLQ